MSALPAGLKIGHYTGGSFTQEAFWREESRTAAINCTPATPSPTVGTSRDSFAGGRLAWRAEICSAMSV